MSRRSVLAVGALTAGVAATESLVNNSVSKAALPILQILGPSFSLRVEREEDLALLDFDFFGFRIDQKSTPVSLRPTGATGVVRIVLPPQAIGEAVYPYRPTSATTGRLPVDRAPILSIVSGPSQICFVLRSDQSIPLPTMTAADLLDWSQWKLVVAPGAVTGNTAARPAAPIPYVTKIEAPYALYLSPVVQAPTAPASMQFSTSFRTPVHPVASPDGVTSCWSATLIEHDAVGTAQTPSVAAVWARDYVGPNATPETGVQY